MVISLNYLKGSKPLKKWILIAEENGINYNQFLDRVNKLKWTYESAATKPIKKMRSKDEKWKSIASKNNIKIGTYRSRVSRGWSKEAAATTPRMFQKRPDQEWLDLAIENGIPYRTYIYRINDMLWKPEEAAKTPLMTRRESLNLGRCLQVEYKEIEHERLFNDEKNLYIITPQHREMALQNGIGKSTLETRIHKLGWTVQEAITKPVEQSINPKLEGYAEHLKKAKNKGIKYETFRGRLRMGWSLADASSIDLVDKKKFRRSDKKWMEIAVKNNIKIGTYKSRVKNGWSFEDASSIRTLEAGEYLNEETKQRALDGYKNFSKNR